MLSMPRPYGRAIRVVETVAEIVSIGGCIAMLLLMWRVTPALSVVLGGVLVGAFLRLAHRVFRYARTAAEVRGRE